MDIHLQHLNKHLYIKKAALFNDPLQMKNAMMASNPLEAKRYGKEVKGFNDSVKKESRT